jgi:MurNAc alpha-1-phosphate uridylyltransferase
VGALETAGGILQALPLLGPEPFLVINGDIWCAHSLRAPDLAPGDLAHLLLVDNPDHHPQGDFRLAEGRVSATGDGRLTFAGIGWYRPEFFADLTPGRRPLAPLLRAACESGRVAGTHFSGAWWDVGTPQRLAELDAWLASRGD